MTFFWKSVDADGNEAAPPVPGDGFDEQAKAEAWLTENFEDLLDQGISHVSLFEEDRLVYGPMGLAPA